MNRYGIETVEVPDLGSVLKHISAANVHLELCLLRGDSLSKRRMAQLEMALRWVNKLKAEIESEGVG